MALRLIDNFPLIKEIPIMRQYARYLHTADFKIDPLLWLIYAFVAALIGGILAWLLFDFARIEQSPQVGFMVFVLVADVLIGYPYIKAEQRIDEIEEILPDALRQMADTLKSGGTYELALKEVATSDYGPLKTEMNEVLRKLEEGENFESAFTTLSRNIDSKLVQRTVTIIVDSIQAGAGLANILEQISEDVRAIHHIGKERKASTAMQVIFMFAAGGLIAPMIFGFVSTIASVLISSSGVATSVASQEAAKESISLINMSIQAYIFVETFFTSVMISIMREGKLTKTIIYFPILLLVAYITYLASAILSKSIIGG